MDVGTAEPAETHTNGSAEALTHASLSFLQLAVQQERPPPGRAHTQASSTGATRCSNRVTWDGPRPAAAALRRRTLDRQRPCSFERFTRSLARRRRSACVCRSVGRSSTTCSRRAAGRSRTRRSHSTRSACSARRRRSTATTAVTETHRDTAPDREAAPWFDGRAIARLCLLHCQRWRASSTWGSSSSKRQRSPARLRSPVMA